MSDAFWKGPHLTNSCCTVDVVAVCAAAWVDMNHTRLPYVWSSWTDTKSMDILKALIDCRQISLIGYAGELNVPKCCVKTGIHTFACALITFSTGWKETAQLPVVDSALPTTRKVSLVSGLCFGSRTWDFDTHTPPSSAANIWVGARKYNMKLRTAMALFQLRRWRLPPHFS